MNFRRSIQAVAIYAVLALLTPAAMAQGREPATPAPTAMPKIHRLVLQVNTADPATMNLALNNASNVEQNYRDLGEKVERAKKLAPTRPHPSAPHSELFHKTVGPGVGMIDRLRDKLTGRQTS